MDQTKRIIINGIKNFEARKKKRLEQYGCLRRTAVVSSAIRRRNKLVGKSSWFRGKKDAPKYMREGKMDDRKKKTQQEERKFEVRTVLFRHCREDIMLVSLQLPRLERLLIVSIDFPRDGISLKGLKDFSNFLL